MPAETKWGEISDLVYYPGQETGGNVNGIWIRILSTETGYVSFDNMGSHYHAPGDPVILFDNGVTVCAEPLPMNVNPYDEPML